MNSDELCDDFCCCSTLKWQIITVFNYNFWILLHKQSEKTKIQRYILDIWRSWWVPYGSILSFCLFSLCFTFFHCGLNEGVSAVFIIHKCFFHWEVHADILIKSEFFFLWRADWRFESCSLCSDQLVEVWQRRVTVTFFFLFLGVPIFYCFLAFLLAGGLDGAERHFRVFPSSSDQFEVISARSGSQAVKGRKKEKEREYKKKGGMGEGGQVVKSQHTMKEKVH